MTLVNNTGQDIRIVEKELMNSLINYGIVPEEIKDIFTVEFVNVNGEKRAILNMVED